MTHRDPLLSRRFRNRRSDAPPYGALPRLEHRLYGLARRATVCARDADARSRFVRWLDHGIRDARTGNAVRCSSPWSSCWWCQVAPGRRPSSAARVAWRRCRRSLEARDVVGPAGVARRRFHRPRRPGPRRLPAAGASCMFLRHRDIGVPPWVRCEISDCSRRPRARCVFTAALDRRRRRRAARQAQVYDVDTGWRLEDGEWRLITAKWTPRL